MIRHPFLLRLAAAFCTFSAIASAQVDLCPGSGWTTGPTHTPGVGPNRYLVVAVGAATVDQGASDIAGVFFGGQAMTLIRKEETQQAGTSFIASLWGLDEAGLALAVGNVIAPAPTGPALAETHISAATYCNVDQANPITATNASEATSNPIDVGLTITDGNSSVAIAGSGNPGSFFWASDVAEETDESGAVSTFSVADQGLHTTTIPRIARASFSGTINHLIAIYAELENATPNPTSDFTGVPVTGPAPLPVSFQDLSSGAVTGWFWTFGDGDTATVQNPTHTYLTPNLYTVSLTVFGPGGTDLEIKTGIDVTFPPPIADFSAAPTSGLSPLNVNFTNLTSGGPATSYSWDFGDGGSSTATDPSHTYTAEGTYTVALTVTGPGGVHTETKTDLIEAAGLVLADFSSDVTTGPAPLTVNFSDTSIGPVTSWNWSFGNAGGSLVQNPQHVFITPGTYTVGLTVGGGGDDDSEVKSDYIVVIDPTAADFTATPLTGTAPLTVSFTDTTASGPTTWNWNFGDGGSSTLQNPTHTFSLPGSYTITLAVDGPGGPDVETKVDYIAATPAGSSTYYNGSGVNPSCFSATPPVVGEPWAGAVDKRVFPGAVASLLFIRMDSTPGAMTTYGEALFNPSGVIMDDVVVGPSDILVHAFTLPSNPALIGRTGVAQPLVLTPSGMSGQFCNAGLLSLGSSVELVSPTSDFTASQTGGPAPLLVAFSDATTGDVTGWSWDFGDGNTSNDQNPSHTYQNEGTFTVTLLTTGGNGFSSEIKHDHIVVAQPTDAEFSANPLSGNIPLTVNFSDLSTGSNVNAWAWDFGDGGSSSAQNPSHTYTVPGTYDVTLTAVGNAGPDTETKTDYIQVTTLIPIAEFEATPLTGPAPLAVSFTDLTVGPVTSWSWTFGDGGSASTQHPTHSYTTTGTYSVSLTATGTLGSTTETKMNYIVVLPPAPMADFSGSPTVGLAPLTVTFTDLTAGMVTAWSWDFGDGGSSTFQHPVYTYPSPGTFTVSLEATGPGGPDTEEKVGYVMVLPPAPTADFSANPTTGPAPLSVSFLDASSGAVNSWAWDFGDGGSASMQNPTYVYATAGTYTVSLTASGPGGSSTETKTNFIVTLPPPLLDGSFEMQTAGMAPSQPWSTLGSGHVIQPDTATLTDNGMPSDASQWAEVSAAGSSGATPPSNPGGPGNPPIGSSSIAQAFGFDEANPVLVFSAAFLLGDDPASALNNDFMSVDISDGTTTHNLYYADTFASFPNTSARHGLPMTDVESVATNLALLFPAATAATLLTVTISLGNAGDGLDDSLGYVDDFFTLPIAVATYRNGLGTNPPCYVAAPPAVGSMWMGTLDSRDRPNVGFVFILLRSTPISQTIALGELLVGGQIIADFSATVDPSGITTISRPLPNNLSMINMGTSQGLLISVLQPTESTLCNAADFTIGFAPPVPQPAADFTPSTLSGSAPLPVSFADGSSASATAWHWDFGDGGSASTQNPSHTYDTPGTYTVWLRATGPGGFDIERKFDLIQVQ